MSVVTPGRPGQGNRPSGGRQASAPRGLAALGGRRSERHYDKVCADLLRRQHDDGSWANSVGPGPVFSTAVACLILQIPKGYLPIFQR